MVRGASNLVGGCTFTILPILWKCFFVCGGRGVLPHSFSNTTKIKDKLNYLITFLALHKVLNKTWELFFFFCVCVHIKWTHLKKLVKHNNQHKSQEYNTKNLCRKPSTGLEKQQNQVWYLLSIQNINGVTVSLVYLHFK